MSIRNIICLLLQFLLALKCLVLWRELHHAIRVVKPELELSYEFRACSRWAAWQKNIDETFLWLSHQAISTEQKLQAEYWLADYQASFVSQPQCESLKIELVRQNARAREPAYPNWIARVGLQDE